MIIRNEQMEILGKKAFVRRLADMLLESEAVDPGTDYKLLCMKVAEACDEAEEHGITTERLMGMYVIIRLSDNVDPYTVPEYAAVLRNPEIAEADKAHMLQMIRLEAL